MERQLSLNIDEAYPLSVRNDVHLLSARYYGRDSIPMAKPIGSIIYRMQKYAADIDIMETYSHGTDLEALVLSFYSAFKLVVNRVSRQKNKYYSETKCGLDTRYTLVLGDCVDGKWYPDTSLLADCYRLHESGLLSDSEITLISRAIKLCGSGDDYDVVHEILRRRSVIRWSADEVLAGHKKLIGGIDFAFTSGLMQDSLVKIDIIDVINGHIIEVTNAYWLSYASVEGVINVQTLDYSPKKDIEKYYYSNLYYNPFKMVKRLFAFARAKYLYSGLDMWRGILERVFDVVSGDISLLYQIKSEIDTIIVLNSRYGWLPCINVSLDNMRLSVSRVLFLSNNEVRQIIHMLAQAKLNDISRVLGELINNHTIGGLNAVGLNPPPESCVPFPMTYAKTVRLVGEELISPFVMVSGNYSAVSTSGDMDKWRNIMASRVRRGQMENM